jgi:EmrB/QacA subfamily drug resistance transporter
VSGREHRPGYLLDHRDTVLALVGVLSGILLVALNQTIFATALPTIANDLGGGDDYSWVFTAYLLAATVTVPVYGKLADVYGRRAIFVFGILAFIAGGVVGMTAQSMTQLIAARAIQGVGAGAVVPLAIIVVGDLVPASERGRWQGLSGAVIGGASIVGPTLGGWISDHADWRYVFAVSLPVAVWSLSVGWLTLGRIPTRGGAGRRVDVAGAALLIVGLLVGLVALAWGGRAHPWGSPEVIGGGAVSALTLAAFLLHERRAPDPILPLGMLRDRTVGIGNLASFTIGAALFATILFVPLFVQGVIGTSATASGVVLTPLLLGLMVASVGSGQLVSRTGRYRWVLLGGPTLMLAAFAWLASLGVGSTAREATGAMVLMGLGIGLVYQNIVLVIQNAVPGRVLAQATGTAHFSRQMGSTIGVAGLGALLAARLPEGGIAHESAAALADAIHPVFVAGIALMAVCFVLLALLPERPLRRTVADEPAVPADW